MHGADMSSEDLVPLEQSMILSIVAKLLIAALGSMIHFAALSSSHGAVAARPGAIQDLYDEVCRRCTPDDVTEAQASPMPVPMNRGSTSDRHAQRTAAAPGERTGAAPSRALLEQPLALARKNLRRS